MAKLTLNSEGNPKKGFTGTLGQCNYVDGDCYLPTGALQNLEGLIRYQKKCYEAKLIVGGDSNGSDKTEASAGSGETTTVQSDVQSDREGSSPVSDDDGSGTDGDPTGGSGSDPEGVGQTDTGILERVKKAVEQLKHDEDAHWTTGGKPAIAAVTSIVGDGEVTRALIDEACPGVKRKKED